MWNYWLWMNIYVFLVVRPQIYMNINWNSSLFYYRMSNCVFKMQYYKFSCNQMFPLEHSESNKSSCWSARPSWHCILLWESYSWIWWSSNCCQTAGLQDPFSSRERSSECFSGTNFMVSLRIFNKYCRNTLCFTASRTMCQIMWTLISLWNWEIQISQWAHQACFTKISSPSNTNPCQAKNSGHHLHLDYWLEIRTQNSRSLWHVEEARGYQRKSQLCWSSKCSPTN